MNHNFCEFIDIGLDHFQCTRCGLVIVSEYGTPALICAIPVFEETDALMQSNLCSIEELEYRYNLCQQCDYFINNTCSKCGCIITRNFEFSNKLLSKDSECPEKKWLKLN